MNSNELYHVGVLGMRWGIRRSKTQQGRGSKKSSESSLEKARQAKQDKKKHEEEKQTALKKGSARDILKFKGDLTNQEMQTALGRINLEKQLFDMSAKETKKGMDKVNSIMNKVDQVNANVNKGVNAYNTVARINNSLSDKKLPVLDGASKKDNTSNEKKKRLIKSGSPEDIIKNFGNLDVKDLEDISKRMSYEDLIRKKHGESR